MKIGEARKTYSAPLREFWEEKKSLAKQKKALDEKIKATPNGKEAFAKEAVTLDLSYRAVSEKYEEYSKTMEQIMAKPFYVLTPNTNNPYKSLYTAN